MSGATRARVPHPVTRDGGAEAAEIDRLWRWCESRTGVSCPEPV